MPRPIETPPKPPVHLSPGVNGNVYAVIGECQRAARRAGWTVEKWDAFEKELLNSRDYDHVLQQILGAFEVS